MPKMRYKTRDGIEFEFEGEEEEILRLYQRVVTMVGQPVSSKTEIEDPELPSDKEVIQYIISKPNFEHDIFDVQERFFGKRFTSRDKETRRMYHRIHRQLRGVRETIEKQVKGKFVSTTGDKGVKRYTFKKEVIHTL